jgi:hypothetical protein
MADGNRAPNMVLFILVIATMVGGGLLLSRDLRTQSGPYLLELQRGSQIFDHILAT